MPMASPEVKAGIVGGAGYTGGEALRILLRHSSVKVVFAQSRSQAGKPVASAHRDLTGETDLTFTESASSDADVVFLCLGHGESGEFLRKAGFPSRTKIIDLSQDFRLGEAAGERKFVYGLPELNRDEIRKAQNVANPGCFATTVQLGLLPLAKAGLLGEVHAAGITGSTGAGQKLQESTHFTWRSANVSPYKVLNHQHLAEIVRSLRQLQPGFTAPVNFVPWRGNFTRGILVTQYLACGSELASLKKLYSDYYSGHPFTHVVDEMVDIKLVVNTNKCLITLEKVGDKLVIHSVTDNLIKGASGQAVQNMNLMFGLEETSGLLLKGSVF
jgi:N-acetyl-gamma-glutamyl-phosphate reductase